MRMHNGNELAKERRKTVARSVLLIAPLVAFLFLFFILPLAMMLLYAVSNTEVRNALPKTAAEVREWHQNTLLPASAFEALAGDLRADSGDMQLGEAARRLDYEIAGYRRLLFKTAKALNTVSTSSNWRAEFLRIDERWSELKYWTALRRASEPITPYYLLAALDLRIDDSGNIVRMPPEQRVYVGTFIRTFWIGGVVTLCCLLLGYPLAYAIMTLPSKFATLLTFSVLLPFWTSLLVRTSAWIVVLSREGIVNSALSRLGLIGEPLQLIFNRTGLYIVMVHILLPFMVLPILSVMKGVSPNYMRASASLGAHPVIGFLKVYLPLTLPGIGAGSLMTFIIAIGYYVTPALVGGSRENMISFFIAFHTNHTINWGMAAALGLLLLTCVLLLYATIGRVIGVSRIIGWK